MKAVVLIPTHDFRVDARLANSLVELGSAGLLAGPPIYSSSSDIRSLRDSMLAHGVAAVAQSKATHLVWADSDMVWLPTQLARLMQYASAHPASAVAALATTRTPKQEVVQVRRADSNPDRRYVQCTNLGFGLVAFDADAISLFVSALPTYRIGNAVVPVAHTGAEPGTGEDTVFWRRWWDAGNEAVVDTEVKIQHVGTFLYGFNPQEQADQIVKRMRQATLER